MQPATVLDVKRSAGVAPELNLWNSIQARKHVSEGSILALKLGADVILNSKQGYQCPHKKDPCLLNIKKID